MKMHVSGIACSLFLFLFSGYAPLKADEFPAITGNLNISLAPLETRYPVDWPPGAYQFDKQNIYVSKMNGAKETNTPQFLFGLTGETIAIGELAGDAKKAIGPYEAELGLDLRTLTKTCLLKQLPTFDKDHRLTFIDNSDHSQLLVKPYLIYSFVDNQNIRMWVLLKAQLVQKGSVVWEEHYFSALGSPRPVEGPYGLTTDRDKILNAYFDSNLQNVVWAFLADIEGVLRPKDPEPKKIDGRWMFWTEVRTENTFVLTKASDRVIVLIKGDIFGANNSGINILPLDFN